MSLRKLTPYKKKRKFQETPEPKGGKMKARKKPLFVLQKHYARSLHFDLRLEIQGVLKSWAVPKGPPKKIGEKHLAISTEDHPLEYAHFEGIIPEGNYGAGKVKIWDQGTFENLKTASLSLCLKKGTIEFQAKGARLKGRYALVHFRGKNWLWIKLKAKT